MYNLLAGVYHRLSGFGLVRRMGEQYLQGYPAGNLQSYFRKKRQRKMNHAIGAPVKVVFIQQNKVNWQVLKPIYEAMIKDSRFEEFIVAVPEKMDGDPEAAYKDLVRQYGSKNVIRTGYRKNDLFDIRHLNPDCVFLPRPYDQYLPVQYQSKTVSSYAKVCYMTYAIGMTEDTEKDVYNGRFFRNIGLYFAETKEREKSEKERYPLSHKNGTRETVCFGYPSLSQYAHLKPRKKDGYINLLWTPRWNDDISMGGSNFLTFKDKIVEYVKSNDNLRLIFRPHPMTFHHFISSGKLSQEEADRYLAQFDGKKMIYDDNPDIIVSFSSADILITDISSIIFPYVLTKKPMIFCDLGSNFNKQGRLAVSGAYFAYDWNDVEEHLDQLLKGNDRLAGQREMVVDTYMKEMKEDHTEDILDYLYSSVTHQKQ